MRFLERSVYFGSVLGSPKNENRLRSRNDVIAEMPTSSTALGFYLVMGAAHVGHRRLDAETWLALLRVAVPSDASRS